MTRFPLRGITLALGVAVVACCTILGLAAVPRGGGTPPAAALLTSFVPTAQHVFGKNRLRVLVVGLDYDYDANDQETSAHSRSDIIMAVNLDFTRRRIYELSVPRDMVATMPDGRQAKINEAQSEGGVGESETVVSHWLGSPAFDRYVVLRIDTMKDLIDALGGVTVNVQNSDALEHAGPNGPVDYDDSWGHLHVHLKPGVQHLTGAEAVGYSRFRHDWCSDPCRIMRQQAVIHALVDQIQHHQLDLLVHAQSMLGVVQKDVQTNLTPGEELSLVATFAHAGERDVVTSQVPYVSSIDLPGYGDSIIADEARKRALVSAMLDDPVPAATPERPRAEARSRTRSRHTPRDTPYNR